MTSLTYFFQFHFIFELLSIFMVMINLFKIELNWKMSAKCFPVGFFLPRELFLIYHILIWSRSRDLNIIWTIT